eukprot:gene474-3805_t
MSIEEAQQIFEKLKNAWRSNQLSDCGNLLTEMKIALTEISFFPTENDQLKTRELVLARDSLEIGALYAIRLKDPETFERYLKQLKVYYFDYTESLPKSSFMYELLGLDLLHLLSQNRIADFHTALERLDTNLLHNNPYIRHPVELEQYLMEGSYNKVHLARESSPSESFHFFLEHLMDTIRREIAASCEAAHEDLHVDEIKELLYMSNDDDIETIIRDHPEWVVDGDKIIFPQFNEASSGLQSDNVSIEVLHHAFQLGVHI